jgi:MOSC domain-containing protein
VSVLTVIGLFRHPVKSMLGEAVRSAELTARGMIGDRAFAVVDRTGRIGSAKHPRKWGALLSCRARTGRTGATTVTLPEGGSYDARDPDLAGMLSKLLDRPVSVLDTPPGDLILERAIPGVDGTAGTGPVTTDETGTSFTTGGTNGFLDFGPVHAITTATLATLRRAHPASDFDASRFRPNIVLDAPDGGDYPEDAWTGRRLTVGGATLEVLSPTPRCVIPTLAHDPLPPDRDILRTIAREHRVPVPTLGRAACVGIYLTVVTPGPVAVGDTVSVA